MDKYYKTSRDGLCNASKVGKSYKTSRHGTRYIRSLTVVFLVFVHRGMGPYSKVSDGVSSTFIYFNGVSSGRGEGDERGIKIYLTTGTSW